MLILLLITVVILAVPASAEKKASVLYPRSMVQTARANTEKYPWAAEIRRTVVEKAAPWLAMSDDELWRMMYGCTITRSWMVWSNGHCPSCKKDVPMYSWIIRALDQPWKVMCPHCKELFPKNDFHRFYLSGLDEHGVFDPTRTDRSLLFNTEHPDPNDPLHKFGVDDGEGYVDGDNRWRFIGTYLIYGQWKQAVHGGIKALSEAYVLTGDPKYAHKAAVMLDRVADLYPTFDFGKQGVVYEHPGLTGYVSTWHDACEEARELAIAYDQVFDGIKSDGELVRFLATKAKRYKLDNPKSGFADVQRNIEDGILLDTIKNKGKINSNFPRTPTALAVAKIVLGWPQNREEVMSFMDETLVRATKADGVTGEKGLAGYSSFTIQGLAEFFGQLSRLDANFIKDLLMRHPRIHRMYRFHIDTYCLDSYYPEIGDSGSFAAPVHHYVGAGFTKSPGIRPSSYTFMWKLYEATGDPAFVQMLYKENESSVDGLPHDLFTDDPDAFQTAVGNVIEKHGPVPELGSVNFQEWRLAILRSGKGKDARAMWLDYDCGGSHGHADGMNLGLFAKGLDLMPDFGYKPVNFGGWGAPKAVWYGMTASHNTVVVDGKNQVNAAGKTTLWADGRSFHVIRASGPELIGGKQYERTAMLLDISDTQSYVVDIFRVIGGGDHAKFLRSHYGEITTEGLSLKPANEYGFDTQMRNFACDVSPGPGWSVDWKVDDRRKILPPGSDVHFRYTDLTSGAQAWTSEAWTMASNINSTEEAWVPSVMVRKQTDQAPLASTFVSVYEPYEVKSNIKSIRRLDLTTREGKNYPDADVAVEIVLDNGECDLVIAADVENPMESTPSLKKNGILIQKELGVQTDAELCHVRLASDGALKSVSLCKGRQLKVGDVEVQLKAVTEFIELEIGKEGAMVVSGESDAVEDVLLNGKSIWRR